MVDDARREHLAASAPNAASRNDDAVTTAFPGERASLE
jgi:hypothetical protein